MSVTSYKSVHSLLFCFSSFSLIFLICKWLSILKGTPVEKKVKLKLKSVKNAKNEPSPTSMCQIVLERFHFKVRNLGKMDIAIFRFSASFSIKYDINEKMKVQYLRSLLFDLFETLQAVRTWQRNFASFQILLLWKPKSKLLSIIEK